MTEKKNTGNEEIQTELGILSKLISLPKQPVSVKWRLNENQERRQGYLAVLLEFKASDYAYILENSRPFDLKNNARILSEIYEKWLPDHAKTGIEIKPTGDSYEIIGTTEKLTGEIYEVIGVSPLQPNLFADAERSSYIEGEITPLKNGFIFVGLSSL